MANLNTIYSATQVAQTAMALVQGDLGIAGTISRSFEAEFAGKVGYTVNIKRPATVGARTRVLTAGQATAITSDTIVEAVASIALDTEVYSAVDVTDAELTMSIADFTSQVTKPQTDAIVQHVEGLVTAQMAAVAPSVDYDYANPIVAFSAARSALRKHRIPSGTMYAACGVDAYAALLNLDLVKTDGTKGSDGELRRTVRGFTVLEHNGLPDDRVVFYHPAAFHLALRAPVVPAGVAFGASTAANGVALRVIRDYDSSLLVDRQVINTYVGVDNLGVVERAANGTNAIYVPAIAADPDFA